MKTHWGLYVHTLLKASVASKDLSNILQCNKDRWQNSFYNHTNNLPWSLMQWRNHRTQEGCFNKSFVNLQITAPLLTPHAIPTSKNMSWITWTESKAWTSHTRKIDCINKPLNEWALINWNSNDNLPLITTHNHNKWKEAGWSVGKSALSQGGRRSSQV